jgi:hypothetical protein
MSSWQHLYDEADVLAAYDDLDEIELVDVGEDEVDE